MYYNIYGQGWQKNCSDARTGARERATGGVEAGSCLALLCARLACDRGLDSMRKRSRLSRTKSVPVSTRDSAPNKHKKSSFNNSSPLKRSNRSFAHNTTSTFCLLSPFLSLPSLSLSRSLLSVPLSRSLGKYVCVCSISTHPLSLGRTCVYLPVSGPSEM